MVWQPLSRALVWSTFLCLFLRVKWPDFFFPPVLADTTPQPQFYSRSSTPLEEIIITPFSVHLPSLFIIHYSLFIINNRM